MKYFILFISLISFNFLYGQSDSVLVPKTLIVNSAKRMLILEDSIRHQYSIIMNLNKQIDIYEQMEIYWEAERKLLNDQLKLTNLMLSDCQKYVRKNAWYDRSWVQFTGGMVGALFISIVVKNLSK